MQEAFIVSTILSWLVIGLLTVLLLMMGRAHAELTRTVQRLEQRLDSGVGTLVGKSAPSFHLSTLDGKRRYTLNDLRGHPALLVFVSPTCMPCHQALQHLVACYPEWQAKGVQLLGISSGDPAEMLHVITSFYVNFPVLSEEQWEVSRAYKVPGTPWGIALTVDGIVTDQGPLGHYEQVTGLLDAAFRSSIPADEQLIYQKAGTV